MKKIIYLIVAILLLTGCVLEKDEDSIINDSNDSINAYDEKKDSDIVNSVNISIDGKEYLVNLEDNDTVREFIKLLPISITMNELNGNEKYYYLDKNITTDSYNPSTINKGDVMLYGSNCLVIFYKTFDTSYSYTKIGHIDNLDDLDSSNVEVKIYK